MYKLAYKTEFVGKNNHIYKVEISRQTEENISVKDLRLLADDPVIIEYKSDDLFQPLKQSACTINILTEAPLLDLYTGKLNDIIVKILKDNELFWFGFLTPNIYSSEYNYKYDQLSLEFIDTIAHLENIKFNNTENSFSSFIELFCMTFDKIDKDKVINEIYYPGNLSIDGRNDILNFLYIQNRNFYDEVSDPETNRTVLEEVTKFLGMTLLQTGNKYMLLDYSTLKAGDYTFNVYNRTTRKTTQTTLDKTVKDLYEDIGIAGANGSISLGDVYNKVKIVASSNPIGDVYPELFDGLTNQNENKNNKYELVRGDRTYLTAYFNSPNFTFTRNSKFVRTPIYDENGESHNYIYYDEITPDNIGETDVCTVFQKVANYKNEDGIPSSLNWSNYLTLRYNPTYRKDNNFTYTKKNVIFKDGYFILDIEYLLSRQDIGGYEPDTSKDVTYKGTCINTGFTLKLELANLYYNGNGWQTTECNFQVYHKSKEGDKVYNTPYHLNNNVKYSDNLIDSEDGILIKLPVGVTNGDLRLCINNVIGLGKQVTNIYENSGSRPENYHELVPLYCHIKDIKLLYTTKDYNFDTFNDNNNNNKDILYENIINDDFITEFEDIELKVNTYNKNLSSFSSVISKVSGNYDYVDTIYDANSQQLCRMEEHIINKYVSYYKSPKIIYTNTLYSKNITFLSIIHEGLLNKNMFVDSLKYDLINDSVTTTLKEV